MSDSDVVASAAVQARSEAGNVFVDRGFGVVLVDDLLAAGPWRTFRWYLGQKHYSGSYWSATQGSHVIYESRLELARLLYADFDPSVTHVVAQPFLMTAFVDGAVRRHIPDFLLMTAAGPLVVDVKPARRLAKPEVAFTFAWSRTVVHSRGWRYEVWSEPAPVELANIRFLSGFRRAWLFAAQLVSLLAREVVDGVTLGEACTTVAHVDARVVKATVMHLLWSGRFTTDLTVRLHPGSVLKRAA